MKVVDERQVRVVKAGNKIELPAPLELGQLMRVLERNDAVVFWMQPPEGTVDDQFACVCVNERYYALSAKLEKAVFRNVRLTQDFRNYEFLPDGTKKLLIPQRLFAEKLRTSSRSGAHMPRKEGQAGHAGRERAAEAGAQAARPASAKRKRGAQAEAPHLRVERVFERVGPACARGAGAGGAAVLAVLAPDAAHVVQQVVDTMRVEFGDARAGALLRAAAERLEAGAPSRERA